MKRFILTGLISVFITGAVQAQTIAGNVVKTDIANVLKQTYYNGLTNYEIEVKVLNVPFKDLVIPDGNVSYKVVSPEGRYLARDIKRINVYVDGTLVKTLNLPVQLKAYKEVLTVKEPMNRDQAVTAENTYLQKIDVADKLNYILTAENLSKEIKTKKPMKQGEILDKRFVKIKPDVVRDTEVRVFFTSNDSLMITIDAIALEDGLLGDYVSVENKNYKKVYKGKIIGENRVLVAM